MSLNATENGSKKDLSLFLGCVAPNRYPGIELATLKVMEKLDIGIRDLEGASCCPAPGVFKSFDKTTWLSLASRNIVLSEDSGTDLLTICNGCYGSLIEADHELKEDPEKKKKVNEKLAEIGMEYKGTSNVRHIIEYLYKEITPEKIKENVTVPLEGIKVAVHYGCHMIRPSKGKDLDSVENPRFFDELVDATGAKSVDYEEKMLCCGAGGGVRSVFPETALKMSEKKLDILKAGGFDCIVDACPFCHLQYDVGQKTLAKEGKEYNIPVLHYMQLLGLAFGYTPEELGITLNVTKNCDFDNKILNLSKKTN
ncbi:MAG: CoB--CoM heterodisulfide reductase subunit B [Methanosarcinaceae archaeon]|nr:CoB--CoM heterodisulfide reductase subunit B [Methanosarcinaceae archaeon]